MDRPFSGGSQEPLRHGPTSSGGLPGAFSPRSDHRRRAPMSIRTLEGEFVGQFSVSPDDVAQRFFQVALQEIGPGGRVRQLRPGPTVLRRFGNEPGIVVTDVPRPYVTSPGPSRDQAAVRKAVQATPIADSTFGVRVRDGAGRGRSNGYVACCPADACCRERKRFASRLVLRDLRCGQASMRYQFIQPDP